MNNPDDDCKPTPLTDGAAYSSSYGDGIGGSYYKDVVSVEFARELENKLAAAMAKLAKRSSRVWVVETQDSFGRWSPCAECQLTKQDCERVIRQYWLANNPDDKFRAKRYIG